MNETVNLRIWGFDFALRGFDSEEIAQLLETFAGSAARDAGGDPASCGDLLLVRTKARVSPAASTRVPRHRGGSSARKFFLDGTLYRSEEQHRDIGIVAQSPDRGVYAEGDCLIEVAGDTVTVTCAGQAPPMLLSDIVEDRLLCRIRAVPAVQVHCAAWLDSGMAVLTTGDSGAGKTTALFGAMGAGATFLSNDRAFLRVNEGRLEVRSFPLPVNVGCGTIRALRLSLPDHGLGDHDKIRLRPAEAAERFGADYEGWYPVRRVLARDRDELNRNVYWDEDECHPFWVRPWHPGELPASFRADLSHQLNRLSRPFQPLADVAEAAHG